MLATLVLLAELLLLVAELMGVAASFDIKPDNILIDDDFNARFLSAAPRWS